MSRPRIIPIAALTLTAGLLFFTGCSASVGETGETAPAPPAKAAEAPSDSGAARRWEDFQKPGEKELRERLTPMQYRVTQENATEPAFHNKYYDNKKPGLYVDIVSGEPLFSSRTKFHSGTGWPSFYKPLEPELVVEVGYEGRDSLPVEVRSKYADSHLGDLFKWDTPTGLRYCLDSAALRFIPADRLKAEGYGEYTKLFKDQP